MSNSLVFLVKTYPWSVTVVFFLLVIAVIFVIGAVSYALKTGRSIEIWNLKIGPRQDQSVAYPGVDLNKQRGSLSPDLHAILSFIEDQTSFNRESIPQTDFDPPKFPHYAYWMLEVLIAYGFVVKESIGQRADAPIYSYKLSPDYKKLLGRM